MESRIIPASFFERDPLICARELIGAELFWGNCSGVLVETEAYNAINDEACHTFMRPSTRAFIERNKAGAAYVYFNYGMHWMLNVLVKGQENGFVLIRGRSAALLYAERTNTCEGCGRPAHWYYALVAFAMALYALRKPIR